MLILGIDTSGKTASAALCDENTVISQTYAVTNRTHSQVILPIAKRVLEDAGMTLADIDGIAAAKGPGSYTGLRIGLSAVKGISFANGCLCYGISTLEALAYNFRGFECRVCAVMHARQDILYNSFFEVRGNEIKRLTEDRLIKERELLAELEVDGSVCYAAGDHAEELCAKAEGRLKTAPPLLKNLLASSLCFAAFDSEAVPAAELNPDYLQITKAEKDLEEKQGK